MPYPEKWFRLFNLLQEIDEGGDFNFAKLEQELNASQQSLIDLNQFVRGFTLADGRVNVAAVRQLDQISVQLNDGTGAQLVFPFTDQIDSTVDLVRVYVGSVLQATPADYTYDDDEVTMVVAPPLGTDNVEIRIYTDMAGVLDRMKELTTEGGAGLVAYRDPGGIYGANDVEGALTEVMTALNDYKALIGVAADILYADGRNGLTDNWEVNARSGVATAIAATGQIIINVQPSDGEIITIGDGVLVSPKVFEYDDNAAVGAGNITVTIGADRFATADNLAAAIATSGLEIGETHVPASDTTDLLHNIESAVGNVTITTTAAGTAVVGMSGGANGTLQPLATRYRPRNIPESLQDGDVVVHEQLQSLINIIATLEAQFLKLAGGIMSGSIDMNGNRITGLQDATAGDEPSTFDQLNAAIAALTVLIKARLSLAGTKASVAEGTMTGPMAFEGLSDGTSVADADQTTDPSAVTVHTIHNLPQASAPDQPVNLLQMTTSIALIAAGIYGNGRLGAVTISSQAQADAIFVGPGVYDFASLIIDGAVILPFATRIRSQGLVKIDVAVTIANPTWQSGLPVSAGFALVGSRSYEDAGAAEAAGFRFPMDHEIPGGVTNAGVSQVNGWGASGAGRGGSPNGLAPHPLGTSRLAAVGAVLTLSPFVGQAGSVDPVSNLLTTHAGGGALYMCAAGDIDMTGGTISVNALSDAAGVNYTGCSGGSIMIVSRGTITGGTYNANGSAAKVVSGTVDQGGGGGGYTGFVAAIFAGVQTTSVAGGLGASGGLVGDAGIAESFTLTAAQIDGLGV